MGDELCTDAVDIGLRFSHGACQHPTRHTTSGGENELMRSLHHDDLVKMAFLICDILPDDKVQQVANLVHGRSSEIDLPSLLQEIPLDIGGNSVFGELLFLTKNYALLKRLSLCKHKARVKFSSGGIIPKFRRLLFEMCENLTDKEFQTLKNLVDDADLKDLPCAESLFLHLSQHGNFETGMYDRLRISLQEMNQKELTKKLEEVNNASNCYQIKSQTPRGLAVIINQENFGISQCASSQDSKCLPDREGSGIDREKLKALWVKFGLKLKVLEDLTAWNLIQQLRNIAWLDHSNYDIFVCCILSHGAKGCVYGVDGQPVSTGQIRALFNNTEAPTLVNKPKLFFIQACQGEAINSAVAVHSVGTDPLDVLATDGPGEAPPNFADMLVAMSTVEGFSAIRSRNSGSWFVSALVDNLLRYWEEEDISQVLVKVNHTVGSQSGILASQQCKQMPEYHSTLRFQLKLSKVNQSAAVLPST